MDDLDVDRYLELGIISVDQVTMLTVTALAEQHHATVGEMAVELIQDGITARARRTAKEHRCVPGEINTRHCRICSKRID